MCRLRLVKFNIETVSWPRKFHNAADAMSRVSQKKLEKEKEETEVDGDNLAYCIVGQTIKPITDFNVYEDTIGPLLTTKEIQDAQANDALYQNIKQVLTKDEIITVDEGDLFC